MVIELFCGLVRIVIVAAYPSYITVHQARLPLITWSSIVAAYVCFVAAYHNVLDL